MAAIYDDPFSGLPGDTPVYRLLKACYMEDDTLHAEDEVIAFTGIPNEFMEPLNEPARVNMGVYLDYLDKCGREAAEKAGRVYTGRITELSDQIEIAMQDARRAAAAGQASVPLSVAMPSKQDIPLRPDLATAAQRNQRKAKPSRLLATKVPEPQGKPTPRPIHVQGKSYDTDAGSNSSLS